MSETESPTIEVIDLEKINAPALYSKTRSELEQMKVENGRLAFDYSTEAGLEQAGKHVWKIRQFKGQVESRRKELKRIALDLGKAVDEPAKEIKAELDAMIAVHQEPIDRVKQAEKDRVEAISKAVESIYAPLGQIQVPTTAANIMQVIESIEAIEITPDVYQERMAEAIKIREEALQDLRSQHQQAASQEARDAELEKLRQERAEREQAEREERIRAEAEAKAKQEAEAVAKRQQEESERREREAAERAERAERERVAAAKQAEADRIAAQKRAEQEKREAVEKFQREQREAEQTRIKQEQQAKIDEARRVSDKKHRADVKALVIAAIRKVTCDCTSQEDAIDNIVHAIDHGDIPHVTINY